MGIRKVVTYEKFGTSFLPLGDCHLEFVQAREESYDRNSRKPSVTIGDLNTDLERRDFTINALARKVTSDGLGDIVDLFNGEEDLLNGVVRTPLEPERTFDDDPLRMIRAIRFVCRFGFLLDKGALEAIRKKKDRILIVSQERITDEFKKIMMTDKPSTGLDLLRKTGLLKIIYPELEKLVGIDQRGTYHHKDVWRHTIKVVDNVAMKSDKLELRLAGLYHDIAKPDTKNFVENTGWTFHSHEVIGAKMIGSIIKRQKISTEFIPYLQKLIRLHLRPISLSDDNVTDSAIRRLIVEAGDELDDLLTLCRADITSGNPNRVKKHLSNFDLVQERILKVENIDELKAFRSPVDGNEIMRVLDLKPSPIIGMIKSRIEDAILEGIIPNEHEAAFTYMMEIKDDILSKSANKI